MQLVQYSKSVPKLYKMYSFPSSNVTINEASFSISPSILFIASLLLLLQISMHPPYCYSVIHHSVSGWRPVSMYNPDSPSLSVLLSNFVSFNLLDFTSAIFLFHCLLHHWMHISVQRVIISSTLLNCVRPVIFDLTNITIYKIVVENLWHMILKYGYYSSLYPLTLEYVRNLASKHFYWDGPIFFWLEDWNIL